MYIIHILIKFTFVQLAEQFLCCMSSLINKQSRMKCSLNFVHEPL
jgi:hypothetical protein